MARIKEKHIKPFRDAYDKFVPKPLYTKDQLDRFYSGHASGIAKEFIAWLKMNPDSHQFLFTGHAGCGKTTELFQMAFQMEKDFNVIYCSAFEIMDKNDPDYKDLLLLMCARLHQSAERLASDKQLSDSELSDIRGLYKPFHDFIQKNVKALYLPELPSFFEHLLFKMRSQPETRSRLREPLKPVVSYLISTISSVSDSLWQITNRRTLIIVDDLDKLKKEDAVTLFLQNGHILTLPRCNIIYTIPLTLYYSNEFSRIRSDFQDCYIIPVVKTHDRKNAEADKNIEKLEALISKRMDIKKICEDGVLRQLILLSGGLLRDLITLIQGCCLKMVMDQKKKRIDQEVVEAVADKRRLEISRLLNVRERTVLRKTFFTKDRRHISEPMFSNFLFSSYILEYRNHEIWFDVHPILRKVLGIKEEKLEE